MSLPGVYLDEDAQSWALIETLKARGLVVVTTTEAEMSNRTDEEQLRFALTRDLVLCTLLCSLLLKFAIRNSQSEILAALSSVLLVNAATLIRNQFP